MQSYGDNYTYTVHKDSSIKPPVPMETLQIEMLIGNRVYHRMIDPVKLAVILPVAGSMVRTADDKTAAAQLLPLIKQPSQLPVHIPESRSMTVQTVIACSIQVKIIRIMDGVHIQVEKYFSVRVCPGKLL